MKLARYQGSGRIEIVEEAAPECPEDGILVETLACGLCSGELMDWYMDLKAPHVLGHEVAGRIIQSRSPTLPEGLLVAPHHHAPCLRCDRCRRGLYVHCEQWRRTRLRPGGMAECFAVGPDNLTDTLEIGSLRPVDAALIEPLACVWKSIDSASQTLAWEEEDARRHAVVGLGAMGLLHMLLLPPGAVGYEIDPRRRQWAMALELDARTADQAEEADVVFVCPGTSKALEFALKIAAPGATLVLFAPFGPNDQPSVDWNALYFQDIRVVNSYSCGPMETLKARESLADGTVRAEQVVSDFIAMDELPRAYEAMKAGEILKAMVVFD